MSTLVQFTYERLSYYYEIEINGLINRKEAFTSPAVLGDLFAIPATHLENLSYFDVSKLADVSQRTNKKHGKNYVQMEVRAVSPDVWVLVCGTKEIIVKADSSLRELSIRLIQDVEETESRIDFALRQFIMQHMQADEPYKDVLLRRTGLQCLPPCYLSEWLRELAYPVTEWKFELANLIRTVQPQIPRLISNKLMTGVAVSKNYYTEIAEVITTYHYRLETSEINTLYKMLLKSSEIFSQKQPKLLLDYIIFEVDDSTEYKCFKVEDNKIENGDRVISEALIQTVMRKSQPLTHREYQVELALASFYWKSSNFVMTREVFDKLPTEYFGGFKNLKLHSKLLDGPRKQLNQLVAESKGDVTISEAMVQQAVLFANPEISSDAKLNIACLTYQWVLPITLHDGRLLMKFSGPADTYGVVSLADLDKVAKGYTGSARDFLAAVQVAATSISETEYRIESKLNVFIAGCSRAISRDISGRMQSSWEVSPSQWASLPQDKRGYARKTINLSEEMLNQVKDKLRTHPELSVVEIVFDLSEFGKAFSTHADKHQKKKKKPISIVEPVTTQAQHLTNDEQKETERRTVLTGLDKKVADIIKWKDQVKKDIYDIRQQRISAKEEEIVQQDENGRTIQQIRRAQKLKIEDNYLDGELIAARNLEKSNSIIQEVNRFRLKQSSITLDELQGKVTAAHKEWKELKNRIKEIREGKRIETDAPEVGVRGEVSSVVVRPATVPAPVNITEEKKDEILPAPTPEPTPVIDPVLKEQLKKGGGIFVVPGIFDPKKAVQKDVSVLPTTPMVVATVEDNKVEDKVEKLTTHARQAYYHMLHIQWFYQDYELRQKDGAKHESLEVATHYALGYHYLKLWRNLEKLASKDKKAVPAEFQGSLVNFHRHYGFAHARTEDMIDTAKMIAAASGSMLKVPKQNVQEVPVPNNIISVMEAVGAVSASGPAEEKFDIRATPLHQHYVMLRQHKGKMTSLALFEKVISHVMPAIYMMMNDLQKVALSVSTMSESDYARFREMNAVQIHGMLGAYMLLGEAYNSAQCEQLISVIGKKKLSVKSSNPKQAEHLEKLESVVKLMSGYHNNKGAHAIYGKLGHANLSNPQNERKILQWINGGYSTIMKKREGDKWLTFNADESQSCMSLMREFDGQLRAAAAVTVAPRSALLQPVKPTVQATQSAAPQFRK